MERNHSTEEEMDQLFSDISEAFDVTGMLHMHEVENGLYFVETENAPEGLSEDEFIEFLENLNSTIDDAFLVFQLNDEGLVENVRHTLGDTVTPENKEAFLFMMNLIPDEY